LGIYLSEMTDNFRYYALSALPACLKSEIKDKINFRRDASKRDNQLYVTFPLFYRILYVLRCPNALPRSKCE
jgi:hypothetical protein